MSIVRIFCIAAILFPLFGVFLLPAHADGDTQVLPETPESDSTPASLSAKVSAGEEESVGEEGAGEDPISVAEQQELIKQEYHGSIEAYQQEIVEIEDLHGVYDSRLAQQLVGLGLAHQNQGENRVAIDVFKRAVHLSRINDGLYGLQQAPILIHLIDSYVADNDWKSANDKQHLLYELQRRNYGNLNAKLLGSLSKMVSWHLTAYKRGSNANHLVRALELNRDMVRVIEWNFGFDDLQLSEALLREALVSYHIADFLATDTSRRNAYRPAGEVGFRSTTPNVSEDDDRVLSSLNPYRRGKVALERRVDLYKNNADASAEDKAKALIQLGDWLFYFNKRESALKVYREALTFAGDQAEPRAQVSNLFHKPHPLDFKIEDEIAAAEELKKENEGFVEAEFNVTAAGRAQNIKIVDSDPPQMMDSLLRRTIRATRFRPQLVDGKPVLTKGVTYRHVFHF